MAGPKTTITFSSLQKYTRKRQLYAKNGFYLSINPTGEVAGTSDESCLYAVLQFLSVGPDLVAIWGLKAKKYLAVDNKGRIFSSEAERKECVFREFFGKNFFNIFRTCHSDTDGKGWYLSIDECGKVSAEKVPYSDEPRLHFIVKTIKNCKDDGNKTGGESNNDGSLGNGRGDKKTAKNFGLSSSEVVWIMYPYQQLEGNLSDTLSSTSSPPSSSCGNSRSSASPGEWTGSGDNSTPV